MGKAYFQREGWPEQQEGQHEVGEKTMESDRPGSESQDPCTFALLPWANHLTPDTCPSHKPWERPSQRWCSNEVLDGMSVTCCHASRSKSPATFHATQREGSCRDWQNPASPGLTACFRSWLTVLQPAALLAAPSVPRHVSAQSLYTALALPRLLPSRTSG